MGFEFGIETQMLYQTQNVGVLTKFKIRFNSVKICSNFGFLFSFLKESFKKL